MTTSSLIVTAALEAGVQDYFDQLRRRYFPEARNFLDAHVTLFHALPGDEQPRVEELLARTVERQVVPVEVTTVMSLGHGVAFRLESPGLMGVRSEVANGLASNLTRQDTNKNELHVTVQNKVDPEVAREVRARLEEAFVAFSTHAGALDLWSYQQGPWEHLKTFPFTG